MKKLLLAAGILGVMATFFACKKEQWKQYTCICTATSGASGSASLQVTTKSRSEAAYTCQVVYSSSLNKQCSLQ